MRELEPVITRERLLEIRRRIEQVYVDDTIYDYIVRIVEETRVSPYFYSGVSPRGSIALLKMAKAYSFMKGKDFVSPQEVKDVLGETLAHRVTLSPQSRAKSYSAGEALMVMLREIPLPRS